MSRERFEIMKTIKYFIGIFVFTFFIIAGFAQERPSKAERRLLVQDFTEKYGASWEIVWDGATETPTACRQTASPSPGGCCW